MIAILGKRYEMIEAEREIEEKLIISRMRISILHKKPKDSIEKPEAGKIFSIRPACLWWS